MVRDQSKWKPDILTIILALGLFCLYLTFKEIYEFVTYGYSQDPSIVVFYMGMALILLGFVAYFNDK